MIGPVDADPNEWPYASNGLLVRHLCQANTTNECQNLVQATDTTLPHDTTQRDSILPEQTSRHTTPHHTAPHLDALHCTMQHKPQYRT